MYKFILTVALLVTACTEWPGPYAFSTPESLTADTTVAVQLINDTAGCELVFVTEPGEYVLPITIVDEHARGDHIIGCAEMRESLRVKVSPRPIEIASRAVAQPYTAVLLAHEMGHTLGLRHVEEHSIMNPLAENTLPLFSESSTTQLKALCSEF